MSLQSVGELDTAVIRGRETTSVHACGAQEGQGDQSSLPAGGGLGCILAKNRSMWEKAGEFQWANTTGI